MDHVCKLRRKNNEGKFTKGFLRVCNLVDVRVIVCSVSQFSTQKRSFCLYSELLLGFSITSIYPIALNLSNHCEVGIPNIIGPLFRNKELEPNKLVYQRFHSY